MTILKNAIYSKLAADAPFVAMFGTRISPEINHPGEVAPRCVYREVSIERARHMGGADTLVKSSVQITVWSRTSEGRETGSEVIRAALDGFKGTAKSVDIRDLSLQMRYDLYDDDDTGRESGMFGRVLEFLVWYRETVA